MLVEVSQFLVSWQNFGLMFEVYDICVELKDGGEFLVKCVILVLDVWQSLLHMCWQFCDFTFWQLCFCINIFIISGGSDDSLEVSYISDLFFC